ncbi:MAG: replication-associated recombination protein A [Clostridiales bacterium]|nr:replication-associated recombination protein A [Clostridiales bacterium]MBS5877481.1 replication-associated recombination protein A [Clostridiales bacterium]MDU3490004.1 replication-associated recombination protein A [Clostridiales bacterium]
MDLFDYMMEKETSAKAPLAARMRPDTLDEVLGQEHILGPDKLLSRAIKADSISSLIFWGPPGTGKTTLAHVIARSSRSEFRQINATTAGKKDMEEAVASARSDLAMYGKKTILFIDEIHRFNKSQQDYLLPYVEDGTIILIGATTENPYFEVNQALISRSMLFELRPICKGDIKKLLKRACNDEKRGLGSLKPRVEEEALDFLADVTDGDARSALNALELAVITTDPSEDGRVRIGLKEVSESVQKKKLRYDKDGDNHYDTVSAFIKSMRGSDPDAAVYYLARMLEAGEDIRFIARRIMIAAAEDVGNADPKALTLAVSASLAVERIGMPEARIILSQAAIYVACAPKSNASYTAIDEALSQVRKGRTYEVPKHLKDAHYKGAGGLGHGEGYKYVHMYPGNYVEQQYLPDELAGMKFFDPTDNGYEKRIKDYLKDIGGRED